MAILIVCFFFWGEKIKGNKLCIEDAGRPKLVNYFLESSLNRAPCTKALLGARFKFCW
jgi:hypothetical protein